MAHVEEFVVHVDCREYEQRPVCEDERSAPKPVKLHVRSWQRSQAIAPANTITMNMATWGLMR
jgi:hypothetical protein